MGARGRKSGSSFTIIEGGKSKPAERPKPPADLTRAEAKEWRDIIAALPADWMTPENAPLLARYCRHIVHAREIDQMINLAFENERPNTITLDKLLRLGCEQTRAMISLATKLRFTQQSSQSRWRQKPKVGRRPWETGSSDD